MAWLHNRVLVLAHKTPEVLNNVLWYWAVASGEEKQVENVTNRKIMYMTLWKVYRISVSEHKTEKA